jgi:tetratricopeptide (TPR) repeat protein
MRRRILSTPFWGHGNSGRARLSPRPTASPFLTGQPWAENSTSGTDTRFFLSVTAAQQRADSARDSRDCQPAGPLARFFPSPGSVVPGDPELRFQRAALLHARGRLEEAAQGYLDLLHYRPEPHYTSVNEGISGHLARHNLALVYQDLGELARAQEQWQAILAERPGYPAARRALQELEARLQRFANS